MRQWWKDERLQLTKGKQYDIEEKSNGGWWRGEEQHNTTVR